IYKDGGATMAEINTEFQQYKDYLTRPQPIPFQVGTSNPTAFWAAVVGSAKANAGTMHTQPTQAAARAAQAAAPPPPPPPVQTYAPPPPAYTPPSQPAPSPPASTPTPAPRRRASGPRTHRAGILQLEHRDYELALQEPPNKDGLRIYGRVAIIWQERNRNGELVVVNDIRQGDYRLQIRVDGEVKEEFPLTRAWKSERAAAIAHAKSQYL
ncbi:MAG TPA: hypothetical protein VF897_02825, partial [Roseiflexaceae bacterium]